MSRRRIGSLLTSLLLHAGVLGFVAGGTPVPDMGFGDGEADLGGEAAGPAIIEEEAEIDFGPPAVALVSIGIVDDSMKVAKPVEAVVVQPIPTPKPPAPAPPPVEPSPLETPVQDPLAAKPPEPKPPEEPPPPPPPEIPPEVLAQLAAEGAAAQPGEPNEILEEPEEPEAPPPVEERKKNTGKKLTKGRKPTGKGKVKSCPVNPDDGITEVAALSWQVERDVVEYYASHIKELMKLGSVRMNKGPDGKPKGFRVGLPKCSLLREAGLRTGDIVTSVNGIHVHDLFTALGAYFKLRKEAFIVVNVQRHGKPLTLNYELLGKAPEKRER